MLVLTPTHKLYLACQPVDFRKGIDGYVAVCRSYFQLDPYGGHCFIFRNRKRTAIKLLLYEGGGFWLCHKRLSTGKFKQWPTHPEQLVMITPAQLMYLLQQ